MFITLKLEILLAAKITRRDLKTINILNIYQVLMSATISKCEVCGLEFGTPGELDEHKSAKHQG